jgi:hypothetical protein
MIFISHRGNLNGQNKKEENKINYIEKTFSFGFDVEIDVWLFNGSLFLGHDEPCYYVDIDWILKNKKKLWVHCKNIDALLFLKNTKINYFWHENDKITLTSRGYIWAYPSLEKVKDSIDVLPEIYPEEKYEFKTLGICSDYIEKYRKNYKFYCENRNRL